MAKYRIDWNDSLVQLHFILREAASDGEKWLKGLDAFTKSYTNGATVEAAFELAIDACEPSEEEWEAARAVMHDFARDHESDHTNQKRPSIKARLKSLAARRDKE